MRKRPKKRSSDQPGIICGSVLDPSCKHPEPNQMLWGRLQSGIWITPWEAIIGGSCHNYHFCHDKRVCRNKSLFVMTKVYLVSQNCCKFCCDKIFSKPFLTGIVLSWQRTCFVATNTRHMLMRKIKQKGLWIFDCTLLLLVLEWYHGSQKVYLLCWFKQIAIPHIESASGHNWC